MTKYLFLTVILCLLSLWSVAQDSLKTLNGHIDQYERRDDFNGIIIIAKDGKVFFSRSIGFANFQDQIKIDQTVSMPLSSITKTFTAMAVMILEERQKLGYDDFVMEYLENIPYKNVTIRHLLNHTSGLKRSYKSDLVTIDQLVDYVVSKKPKLSFEPGDKFQYSNLGYSLLAAIVQEVSGKSFETFLNMEIFQPLDLTNTFLLTKDKWKRPRAICYDK